MFLKIIYMFLEQIIKIYFYILLNSSKSYICTSCLHNIIENKPSLYQVPKIISSNKIIPLVFKKTHLKEHLISSHLAFV
jgi:hypothetical protein